MEEINYKEVKNLCQKLEIDPTQLLLLESIVQQKEDDYYIIKNLNNHPHIHSHNIEVLCRKDYISIVQDKTQYTFLEVIKQKILVDFNDLVARENVSKFFEKTENSGNFISRMYEKFPKIKIPTSGKPLRSGETEFTTKLERFIKEHKFSLETIEKAIDLYIVRGNQNNWQYAQTAGYFVYKRVEKGSEISALEGYCEEAKDLKKEDMVNTIAGQINMFTNL